ncbi:MAG TPA: T9SS type A sorting domain-containing protein [Bacteroidia bacterium]|jgi:uncharacterized delta-60 repeat protein|nr:T9SS type A sorting domain-containing protein [Bacteroidia bacterium]
MKTKKPSMERLKRLCFGASFLMLSSITLTAQTGQNDPNFNSADNISRQGANQDVSVSVVQPDNKILIAGEFTTYNGARANQLTRLNADGKKDKNFKIGNGPNGPINSIALQTDNKIIIAGDFNIYNTIVANKIARLNTNGTIDNSFNGGVGANSPILQVINQSNDKILVAGNFTTYNSVAAQGLVRLNKNGSLDHSFHAVITDSLIDVQQIALQPDGKIIVAGLWSFVEDSYPFHTAIRLNADGSRDFSFQATPTGSGDLHAKVVKVKLETDGSILLAVQLYDAGSSVPYHGSLIRYDKWGNKTAFKGFFWETDLLVQQDGKIILVGFANTDWFVYKRKVIRLNTDFGIDSTFLFNDENEYRSAYDCFLSTAALQSNGKIIIAGHFYEVNGFVANNIARLNTNGTFDDTFNSHNGCNGTVLATAVQSNQRIIMAGIFSRYNSESVNSIVRLRRTGQLDPSFDAGSGANGKINTVAIQSDGKILIGGKFTSFDGNACNNIARLNADGSFETGFSARAQADGKVRKIKIDVENRIVVAGDFRNVDGEAAPGIARLYQSGKLDETFQSPLVFDYQGGVYDFVFSGAQLYAAVIYKNVIMFTVKTDLLRLNDNGDQDVSFTIPANKAYEIFTVALTNNGKPVAGGLSSASNGLLTQYNLDGTIDPLFEHEGITYRAGAVRTIQVLENDKLIIGGDFANHLKLIRSNGYIDDDFSGSTGNNVYTLSPASNEKLIVGGVFSDCQSVVRNSIARIRAEVTVLPPAPAAMAAVSTAATDVVVYPVPASSSVNIQNLAPGSVFKIFNAIGQEKYSGIATTEKSTIELSNYVSGIYFIVAEVNGKQYTSKFSVEK